jgi:hypothetical protein
MPATALFRLRLPSWLLFAWIACCLALSLPGAAQLEARLLGEDAWPGDDGVRAPIPQVPPVQVLLVNRTKLLDLVLLQEKKSLKVVIKEAGIKMEATIKNSQ